MIRRSTLIAVEVLMGLIAALAIGVGIAWWRLSQGPIEMAFLRQQLQAELSAARSGRPVGLDRVELAWTGRGGLELRAVNVTVEDGRGGVLSRADEARIELAVLPLMIGRIRLLRAEFQGGALTLTRKLDGAVHLAFGPEGAPPDIVVPPPPPNETIEQRVVRMLDGMEAAFRPIGPGGGLRELSVRGAQLSVIDEAGGGRWTAQGANIQLARHGQSLSLAADARLEGAAGLAPATLRVTTDTAFQTAAIEFGAQDVRPRALFSPAALGPFAALDAPMTTTISIGLDRDVGVNNFEGEVVIGRGAAESAAGIFSLHGGRVHARYDIASDELIIDQLSLNGDRTRVGGEIRIRDVSAIMRAAPNEPANFNVSLPSLRLDVPGTFSEPISLSNVEIVGAVTSADREIRFSRLHARAGQAVLEASGRYYWAEAGGDNRVRPGIELTGAIEGVLAARSVIHMWPMGLGEGARAFLDDTMTAGRVSDAVVRLDIRPADFAAGVLRDEAVDIRFNLTGGAMRFIPTMSPVVAARASGVLRGNGFDMTVPQARINRLSITNGRIEIPRFKPRGDMATISARIEGPARRILEVLAQRPLSLGDRLPIDAATATGHGVVLLRLQRPMLSDVPFEGWRFNVDGTIRDLAGTMTGRNLAIGQGQLTVRGDQRAIVVTGPIRAGTSAIQQVRWTEHLGAPAHASSEYQISGDFDANDLERLGYPVAQYAQGRIGVTVTGRGRGFDVNNARIDLNLTNAAVEAPRGFWSKRAGQAASARFTVERQRDGGLLFNNIDARGAGLNAQGRVRLARDNRVLEVDLPRLVVEGRSDARLTAVRASDNGVDVTVRGALFDAAPFMGSDRAPGAQAAAGRPAAAPVPFRASVVVDRLKLRGDATLANARVSVATHRGALARLSAEGSAPNRRAFTLAINPEDAPGRIRLRSQDAGFAVAALTGAENIVGGRAEADGDWRAGPPSQARFNVRLRDFQVVRLPAMARLLSSAGSLTGLVETLNGDGIGFNALDADMAYANDRLTFSEGRMAGPSLGLTGSGAYNIEGDNLDIDGVVAPSPALNLSMLGNIPVIGDLLVSRRGEGVFGMTYSINGPAAQPRVGVNPVSALTPGILRRIFEPVRENTDRAPALPPPDPPLPAAPRRQDAAPREESVAASE